MSVGPVELVVVAFPGNQFKGEIIPAIQELVDAGTIRIIDVLFAIRQGDDSVRVLELAEIPNDLFQRFDPVVAEVTGLLTPNDAEKLSAGLPPDSSVLLLLFEHTWARKVADALEGAGGRLVLTERIPRQVVQDLIAEREQLIAEAGAA
jgi:uncharacterized membrane protein